MRREESPSFPQAACDLEVVSSAAKDTGQRMGTAGQEKKKKQEACCLNCRTFLADTGEGHKRQLNAVSESPAE
jgi:hypothetical protein